MQREQINSKINLNFKKMKTKKLTQQQYILFISCAQRMLNHYVKLQNEAKKENQNELVDFYEKEIVEISNLFLELNIN